MEVQTSAGLLVVRLSLLATTMMRLLMNMVRTRILFLLKFYALDVVIVFQFNLSIQIHGWIVARHLNSDV